MRISLVRISLLRFFKTFHKYLPYANFGLFISLVRFLELKVPLYIFLPPALASLMWWWRFTFLLLLSSKNAIYFLCSCHIQSHFLWKVQKFGGGNQYLNVFCVNRFYGCFTRNLDGGGANSPLPPGYIGSGVAKVLFLFFFLDTTKHVSSLTELL